MDFSLIASKAGARLWSFALALVVIFALTGCAQEYVGVRSRFAESERQSAREVVSTPQYRQALEKITNVAVRAPDSCVSQTASEATGTARKASEVLSTKCGVEMAEIERALTRVGYAVSSWLELARMAQDGQGTHRAAAQKLGAQVLFQVNSLEKVTLTLAHDAQWERTFFSSNAYGQDLGPVDLTKADAAALRHFLADGETRLGGARLGAMLDVNAVLVETGQSIWFYRWQVAQPMEAQRSTVSVLTVRNDNRLRPVDPRRESGSSDSEQDEAATKSREVVTVSADAQPASREDKIYFELMRAVTKDFAENFKSGKGQDSKKKSGNDANVAPPIAPPQLPSAPRKPQVPEKKSGEVCVTDAECASGRCVQALLKSSCD